MSRNLLLILAAGVDIWAALFLVQLLRPQPAWEASVALQSTSRSTAESMDWEPLTIWITRDSMGIWPDRSRGRTIQEVEAYVKAESARRGEPVSLRLLCDPHLEIRQWSRVAVGLSAHVRQVHIAPLP